MGHNKSSIITAGKEYNHFQKILSLVCDSRTDRLKPDQLYSAPSSLPKLATPLEPTGKSRDRVEGSE